MGKYTMSFKEISASMVERCGGKAAHLGELTNSGFVVPPGFSVTSDAFFYLLEYNNLQSVITEICNSIDFDNLNDLETKTSRIRKMIIGSKLPPEFAEISDSYRQLVADSTVEPYVAIRSSVAVKGTDISSFPGMMDTYHYIRGAKEVVQKVKECWASVWTARAAAMRQQKGIDHFRAIIAPVVQVMVDPDVAGVAFTANPMTGNINEIVIESNWGLGESVVSGKVMSDFFVIDKMTLQAKTSKIGRKTIRIGMDTDTHCGRKEYPIEPDKVKQPSLNNHQLTILASAARDVEKHYGSPRDIEFAFVKDTLYILQARKILGLPLDVEKSAVS